MANYTLKIHPRINGQLTRHSSFIARVKRPAAIRFYRDFKQLLGRISKNPYQFPPYENQAFPSGAYRKALFAKWYQVVFCVDGDTVYLEAVVDVRQTDKV